MTLPTPDPRDGSERTYVVATCDECGDQMTITVRNGEAAFWCDSHWFAPVKFLKTVTAPLTPEPGGERIAVEMSRGQWLVLLGAAANFETRVPREQGDGGEGLRLIADAIGEEIPPLATREDTD